MCVINHAETGYLIKMMISMQGKAIKDLQRIIQVMLNSNNIFVQHVSFLKSVMLPG